MAQRIVVQPEAKFLDTKLGRFVGFRFRETRDHGFSYHYFPIGTDGQLQGRVKTVDFISKMLNLPKPTKPTNYLAKFYDPVWDESVDMAKVKRLRQEIRDGKIV